MDNITNTTQNMDDGQTQTREGGSQSDSLVPSDQRNDPAQYRQQSDSPYELMRRFSDDVDRIFASLGFGSFGSSLRPWGIRSARTQQAAGAMSTMAWTPSVDINTQGDDLIVCADLPGVKPENVQIECDNNQLIIRGETRNEQNRQNQGGYNYTERSYGSFYRSIPLPPGVNPDNAKADFNNGVLQVTFPGAAKSLGSQRRRIAIGGAQQSPTMQSQPSGSSQTMQGEQGLGGSQSINRSTDDFNSQTAS
jgi:HSP20 family protein